MDGEFFLPKKWKDGNAFRGSKWTLDVLVGSKKSNHLRLIVVFLFWRLFRYIVFSILDRLYTCVSLHARVVGQILVINLAAVASSFHLKSANACAAKEACHSSHSLLFPLCTRSLMKLGWGLYFFFVSGNLKIASVGDFRCLR